MGFSIYRPYDDDFILDGVTYTRNASFDNILKIIELSNDKQFGGETKILTGVLMMFGEALPEEYSLEEQNLILESALEEYLESKHEVEYDDLGDPMPEPLGGRKLMDIDYDAQAIYSSFLQAYGIDLLDELGVMHWYKFKALLAGLPDKTRLKELISIRGYEKPSKNENYENQMMKLKQKFALPSHISGLSANDDEFDDDEDEWEVAEFGG